MNLYENAMRSLVDAYIKCGGDPNDLLQSESKMPALSPDEAAFFKQYEDQMGNANG